MQACSMWVEFPNDTDLPALACWFYPGAAIHHNAVRLAQVGIANQWFEGVTVIPCPIESGLDILTRMLCVHKVGVVAIDL